MEAAGLTEVDLLNACEGDAEDGAGSRAFFNAKHFTLYGVEDADIDNVFQEAWQWIERPVYNSSPQGHFSKVDTCSNGRYGVVAAFK